MGVLSERLVKAVRKRHRCDGCGKHIEVGQPAMRWAGLTDGDFGTCIYHPDCLSAEVDLNNDVLDWQYGDDWLPLIEIDEEDWPWLSERYPTVAARIGLAPSPEPHPGKDAKDTGHG